MESNGTFHIEQLDDTLIVTPQMNLNELEYQRIERDGKGVLDGLAGAQAKNVVIDLAKADYTGSTALGFFLKLWKRSRMQNGRMALCNVSSHEDEILRLTRLDVLWPVCKSRDEALAAVTCDDHNAR